MTFINHHLRTFLDASCIIPLKRRSEGRLKDYLSTEDVRTWCLRSQDQRMQILDLVSRDYCFGDSDLLKVVLPFMQIKYLNEVKKCCRLLWLFLTELDLSEDDKSRLECLKFQLGSIFKQILCGCQCSDIGLRCVCSECNEIQCDCIQEVCVCGLEAGEEEEEEENDEEEEEEEGEEAEEDMLDAMENPSMHSNRAREPECKCYEGSECICKKAPSPYSCIKKEDDNAVRESSSNRFSGSSNLSNQGKGSKLSCRQQSSKISNLSERSKVSGRRASSRTSSRGESNLSFHDAEACRCGFGFGCTCGNVKKTDKERSSIQLSQEKMASPSGSNRSALRSSGQASQEKIASPSGSNKSALRSSIQLSQEKMASPSGSNRSALRSSGQASQEKMASPSGSNRSALRSSIQLSQEKMASPSGSNRCALRSASQAFQEKITSPLECKQSALKSAGQASQEKIASPSGSNKSALKSSSKESQDDIKSSLRIQQQSSKTMDRKGISKTSDIQENSRLDVHPESSKLSGRKGSSILSFQDAEKCCCDMGFECICGNNEGVNKERSSTQVSQQRTASSSSSSDTVKSSKQKISRCLRDRSKPTQLSQEKLKSASQIFNDIDPEQSTLEVSNAKKSISNVTKSLSQVLSDGVKSITQVSAKSASKQESITDRKSDAEAREYVCPCEKGFKCTVYEEPFDAQGESTTQVSSNNSKKSQSISEGKNSRHDSLGSRVSANEEGSNVRCPCGLLMECDCIKQFEEPVRSSLRISEASVRSKTESMNSVEQIAKVNSADQANENAASFTKISHGNVRCPCGLLTECDCTKQFEEPVRSSLRISEASVRSKTESTSSAELIEKINSADQANENAASFTEIDQNENGGETDEDFFGCTSIVSIKKQPKTYLLEEIPLFPTGTCNCSTNQPEDKLCMSNKDDVEDTEDAKDNDADFPATVTDENNDCPARVTDDIRDCTVMSVFSRSIPTKTSLFANMGLDFCKKQEQSMKILMDALEECREMCKSHQRKISSLQHARNILTDKIQDCISDLELLRSSNHALRPADQKQMEQKIKLELKALKQYCVKLGEVDEQNQQLKINQKILKKNLSDILKNDKNEELNKVTKERDFLKEKVKILEKQLKTQNLNHLPDEINPNNLHELPMPYPHTNSLNGQLEEKSKQVLALENKVTFLTAENKYLEVQKIEGRCKRLQNEIQDLLTERQILLTKINLSEKERNLLRAKLKDMELLKLERDKLLIDIRDMEHVLIDKENLGLKCKQLENKLNQENKYKTMYEELLIAQNPTTVENELLKKESCTLKSQVNCLQKLIKNQETEMTKIMDQFDRTIQLKEDSQARMREILSSLRKELELKDSILAKSEEKFQQAESELKSTMQGVACERNCYKSILTQLENELNKAKKEIQELESVINEKVSFNVDRSVFEEVKAQLDVAREKNEQLQQVINSMGSFNGDEHIHRLLKQSELAIKSLMAEISRQYKVKHKIRHMPNCH